jgi:hypothetical protein
VEIHLTLVPYLAVFSQFFSVSFCSGAKTADDAVMTCRMKMRAQLKIKFSRKHTNQQKAELHGEGGLES